MGYILLLSTKWCIDTMCNLLLWVMVLLTWLIMVSHGLLTGLVVGCHGLDLAYCLYWLTLDWILSVVVKPK